MIRIVNAQQTIRLQGTKSPRLNVVSAPAQTIRLTSSGPPGPRGETGPRGEQGVPGPVTGLDDIDLPDFTLLFDNKLV